MPSIILSDNGVSSGSAGIKTTGAADGVLALQTTTSGGTATTAMTIDTSQNVGVGVTPLWAGGKGFEIGSNGNALASVNSTQTTISQNAYHNGTSWTYARSSTAVKYQQYAGTHTWQTAASGTAGNAITFTDAMTLDSGSLLIGTTTSGLHNSNSVVAISYNGSVVGQIVCNHANATGSGERFAKFGYNGGEIGNISQSGTTAVSYNTSSDYRLKNTIAPMTGALAKVAALKPCTYKWNADDSEGEGFIAHELAEVCPHAVTGEKDAVDADGNPQYQGIDTSFLVATLTAAIQEQQAIITTLTERITALEAK